MTCSVNVNRLVHEVSPYLRQHSTNPVDWRPWDERTLAEIRKKRMPVFLSIGFSSCHWCHVMERESFSSPATADILNRYFIPVKVDREEYPEVDHLYMTVTRILTGNSGWPNNLWLTPELLPFHAGGYFTHPAFQELCVHLAKAYQQRPAALEARGRQIMNILEEINLGSVETVKIPPGAALLEQGVDRLAEAFDAEHGGFAGIPKFPPHTPLRFLLHYRIGDEAADKKYLEPALRTLAAMAAGGIRDHLGGGFHRYALDDKWVMPRFEKMLYDNALHLANYTLAWKASGHQVFLQAAIETADWLVREMQAPEGGFYCSLDAESEDREGACYLWTVKQIESILSPREAKLFCSVYGVRDEGNFSSQFKEEEEGARETPKNILHLPLAVEQYARTHNLRVKRLAEQLQKQRRQLLTARNKRIPPARDEKILADWNGLAIYALALAGGLMPESGYLEAAAKAADYLSRNAVCAEGNLAHSLRGRLKPIPGCLDDYAFFIRGLLELHRQSGISRWCELAEELAWRTVAEFADRKQGGFYFSKSKNNQLLPRRHRDAFDQTTPSGNAVMTECLIILYQQTRLSPYLEIAERTLSEFSGSMQKAPLSTMGMMTALQYYLQIDRFP